MIARLTVHGQETWHHNVTHAESDGRYLTLDLASHPSRVHFYLGGRETRVLLCADGAEITKVLRDEYPESYDKNFTIWI